MASNENDFLAGCAQLGLPLSHVQQLQLRQYYQLLATWNKTYNLVAPSTMADAWVRHFLDSAQVAPHLKEGATVLDFGSGAGFPGLVCAILKDIRLTTVERIGKKCLFQQEVVRQLGLKDRVRVVQGDVLTVTETYDFILARAVTTLTELMSLCQQHIHSSSVCLFLKGAEAQAEVAQLKQKMCVTSELVRSITSTDGFLVRLEVST